MDKCFGCISILFGRTYTKRRLKYLVNYRDGDDKNVGVEFENLILDDSERPSYGTDTQVISQEEREFVTKRQYDRIIEEQRKVDEQIDKQLFEEEELLRVEEEAYYEAQKEAAKAASMTLSLKEKSLNLAGNIGRSQNSSNRALDEVEDDFEDFLEEVRSRSVAFRSQYASNQQSDAFTIPDTPPSPSLDRGGDGQSSEDDYVLDGNSSASNRQDKGDSEWDSYTSGFNDDASEGAKSKPPLEERMDPVGKGNTKEVIQKKIRKQPPSRNKDTLDRRAAAERMFSITDDEDMEDFVHA